MNTLLKQQLDELLSESSMPRTTLQCEAALRVGAATLCRAAPGEITATTVVCDLQEADVGRFESLVQDVADEYGLDANIRARSGAYAVRFTVSRMTGVPIESLNAHKSLLARLFGG